MAKRKRNYEMSQEPLTVDDEDDIGINDNLDDDDGGNDMYSPDNDNEFQDNFMSDDGFFGGNMGGDPPMVRHQELLKDLTNFDPTIREMVNHWLGRYWNPETQKYERDPNAKPMINECGATYYAGYLRTYAKSTNIITNLDEKQSAFLQEDIIMAVFLSLGDKMEEFNIKSTADMLIIANQVIHSAFLVLFGAEDGKYNKMLSETTTRSENVSYNPNNMMQGGYGFSNNTNNNNNTSRKPGFFTALKRGIFGGR